MSRRKVTKVGQVTSPTSSRPGSRKASDLGMASDSDESDIAPPSFNEDDAAEQDRLLLEAQMKFRDEHGDDDFINQNFLLDKAAIHKFQDKLETVNPQEVERIEKAKEISFLPQDIKRIVE